MTTTLPQPAKKRTTTGAPGTRVKPRTDPPARPKARPSTTARPARPARDTRPAARAPRTPFVLLVVGLLGGALVSLLLLNTVLAEDAFRLNDLQRQNTAMLQHEQALRVEVNKAEAPGALAHRARQLGMRPGPATPAFADAQHTKTLGAGHQAAKPKPSAQATQHPVPNPTGGVDHRAPKPSARKSTGHPHRSGSPAHHRSGTHRAGHPASSPSGGGGAFAGGGR